MIENLSEAYRQIKGFAFKAVVAQRQEKRAQTLFGKFVPEHVLAQFFANPEDTLVGDNRVLSVLFSDIRSFTTHLGEHAPRRAGPLPQPLLRHHGRDHHEARWNRGQVHRRCDQGLLRRPGRSRAEERLRAGVGPGGRGDDRSAGCVQRRSEGGATCPSSTSAWASTTAW